MAYACKHGGECVSCGECSAKEKKEECVKCPVCGKDSSLMYRDIDDGTVGCEHCVFPESAQIYLIKEGRR